MHQRACKCVSRHVCTSCACTRARARVWRERTYVQYAIRTETGFRMIIVSVLVRALQWRWVCCHWDRSKRWPRRRLVCACRLVTGLVSKWLFWSTDDEVSCKNDRASFRSSVVNTLIHILQSEEFQSIYDYRDSELSARRQFWICCHWICIKVKIFICMLHGTLCHLCSRIKVTFFKNVLCARQYLCSAYLSSSTTKT